MERATRRRSVDYDRASVLPGQLVGALLANNQRQGHLESTKPTPNRPIAEAPNLRDLARDQQLRRMAV